MVTWLGGVVTWLGGDGVVTWLGGVVTWLSGDGMIHSRTARRRPAAGRQRTPAHVPDVMRGRMAHALGAHAQLLLAAGHDVFRVG